MLASVNILFNGGDQAGIIVAAHINECKSEASTRPVL